MYGFRVANSFLFNNANVENYWPKVKFEFGTEFFDPQTFKHWNLLTCYKSTEMPILSEEFVVSRNDKDAKYTVTLEQVKKAFLQI